MRMNFKIIIKTVRLQERLGDENLYKRDSVVTYFYQTMPSFGQYPKTAPLIIVTRYSTVIFPSYS